MTAPEKQNPSQPREFASTHAADLDCAAFQQGMAARMAAGDDFDQDPHLRQCPRCQALLAELETIAQAARMLLPTEEEPDDMLWQKIEKAIASDRT